MKFNKIFCDNCKREIENVECSDIQMRFVITLNETMDDGNEYHFCDVECLKEFVNNHKFQSRFYKYPPKVKK